MSFSAALDWILANAIQLIITAAFVVSYIIFDRFATPKLVAGADQSRFVEGTAEKAIRVVRILAAIVGVLIIAFVWGVGFGPILVFTGTTLTLLGVALFAAWSLLSNITAYFVLLLHPSFRRGTYIRVIDADNFVEGFIAEVTLFNTRLITESREVIIYPNNLMISRPTVLNPRQRLGGVGKIADTQATNAGQTPEARHEEGGPR